MQDKNLNSIFKQVLSGSFIGAIVAFFILHGVGITTEVLFSALLWFFFPYIFIMTLLFIYLDKKD